MNNASYKKEYERRDLRLSLIAKNITCGVRIHFPAYCFQNSSGTLTVGRNAIYREVGNGTRVDKYKSGYFIHRTNGEERQTWQMTE
jgi:hypothetical protein